jgi:uncharacterized delta-60 repeat protein
MKPFGFYAVLSLLCITGMCCTAEDDPPPPPPAGPLDTTFGTNGVVLHDRVSGDDFGLSVALQADGKILVAGRSHNGTDLDLVLFRFHADGSLDAAFDTDGVAVYDGGSGDDAGSGVALQADGRALVAGWSHNGSNNDLVLLRFNTDGSLDTTFDGDGVAIYDGGLGHDFGSALVIQADGRVLVAGLSDAGIANDLVLLRFLADGSLDATFDSDGVAAYDGGFDDFGNAVALQADGKVLVAGGRVTGPNTDLVLVRFHSDGSLDATFDGDGVAVYDGGSGDSGDAVAIQADGKILVAGCSSNGTDLDLALFRFNDDGSLDIAFDTDGVAVYNGGPFDRGYSLALQADGKALVAGCRENATDLDLVLLRFHADGSLDTTFDTDGVAVYDGGSGDDTGNDVALQADGKALVTGTSDTGSSQDLLLLRFK